MKKIINLAFIFICIFTLASCKDYDAEAILEDTVNEYYLSSYNTDWEIKVENKMTPTNLGNPLVSSIIPEDKKAEIKHLYYGTVILNRNSETNTRYNDYEINEGLLFEVVKTNNISDSSTYIKIPGHGCLYESYTPDTLYTYNTLNLYTGAGSKVTGKATIILAEYTKKIGRVKYGMGIVNVENVTDNNNNNQNIPHEDKFDDNNKENKLPTTNLTSNVQDGVILHAWNWSYKNIEKSLNDIVNAGYSAIQVSPVQQPKDYSETYGKGWAQQWWKFYQPVSYSIAKSSWLGTKEDLISLCKKADECGVKIIVDIVSNHSASKTVGKQDDPNTLADEVKKYEPELYNGSSKYVRKTNLTASDYTIENVVRGHLGMPELNTGDPFVQNMILDLLKECIDCGVDGFRFDAAKHIETPDDGACASNFWPTILNGATNYAKGKNQTLYYYGEILNTCGNGREYSSYTKYMSVTDNKTGDNIRKAIVSKNASSAANSSYTSGLTADKVVLWAESHDTYANDARESTDVTIQNINKTWALVAARKNATALYFARPGEVGSIGTYNWKDTEVIKVNQFHNDFVGANENVHSSGDYAIVERYDNDGCGAVIVNCNGTSSLVNVTVNNLADGTYIDEITGNIFTVTAGNVTGNMGNSGIVVLNSKTTDRSPIINISQKGGFYSESIQITVEIPFATEARVVIGDKVEHITGTSTFTIGKEVKNLDKINVEISAINDKYRLTENYEFVRIDGVTNKYIVVNNVPDKYLSADTYDLYAWVWASGQEGYEKKVSIKGTYVLFDVYDSVQNFMLVVVKKGDKFGAGRWDNVQYKTCDFIRSQNAIYSADNAKWFVHVPGE